MNLRDAIRSGCLIRRLNNKKLMEYGGKEGWVHPDYLIQNVGVTRADIEAENWEIQEKEVTISRSKLYEAYMQALKQCRNSGKLNVKNIREAMMEVIFGKDP